MSSALLIPPPSELSSIRHENQNLHQSTSKYPSSNFTSTETLMLEELDASLGGATDVRHAVANFMKSAKELQKILQDGNEIHCFRTCLPNSSDDVNQQASQLFTLVSKLFHKALASNETVRNVTTQALHDVFFIAKRSVAVHDSAKVAHEQSVRAPRLPIVPFSLSTLFLYNKNENADSDSSRQQHRPTHLFCLESVDNEVMK